MAPKNDTELTALFKVLSQPHLQKFAAAMASYLREDFEPTSELSSNRDKLTKRSKVAQKLLQGMKRVV